MFAKRSYILKFQVYFKYVWQSSGWEMLKGQVKLITALSELLFCTGLLICQGVSANLLTRNYQIFYNKFKWWLRLRRRDASTTIRQSNTSIPGGTFKKKELEISHCHLKKIISSLQRLLHATLAWKYYV